MGAMFEHQRKFLRLMTLLLAEAVRLDLPVKFGCFKCNEPGHHARLSLHHDALAGDLPMVWPDGRYGTWEEYQPLGNFWKSLDPDCAWGGDFDLNMDGVKKDDANHFSLRFQGRR